MRLMVADMAFRTQIPSLNRKISAARGVISPPRTRSTVAGGAALRSQLPRDGMMGGSWFCARGLGARPQAEDSRAAYASCAAQADAVASQCDDTIDRILQNYWDRSPTAVRALEVIRARNDSPTSWDHFAFRTFGAGGWGIASLAPVFEGFGYAPRDELHFEAKKLFARWYAPPAVQPGAPPLPRIFISELRVDELSSEAQSIIKRYTALPPEEGAVGDALVRGGRGWGMPTAEEFDTLARESEYAAWTLVNGYALNHTTVAAHNLEFGGGQIGPLNDMLVEEGFKLNTSGGVVKASPDGGLLQSSTVADAIHVEFACGERRAVPGAYIEFAERLVLPQHAHLPPGKVEERHRRDGFEASNADKIFESTTMAMGEGKK